ncbi:hypothetical protein BT63DRAFT_442957 [Microthyrium microscopicum]|uniref:Glycosyltransferase family 2 protein n=1 Tax=Microthyrium microscopicum TaxID=703497 RepID=A0A6A6U3R6_9PEZI|nr:hypothetical protein BT63DRAFT_442957 [Microthyrium microscopicum]
MITMRLFILILGLLVAIAATWPAMLQVASRDRQQVEREIMHEEAMIKELEEFKNPGFPDLPTVPNFDGKFIRGVSSFALPSALLLILRSYRVFYARWWFVGVGRVNYADPSKHYGEKYWDYKEALGPQGLIVRDGFGGSCRSVTDWSFHETPDAHDGDINNAGYTWSLSFNVPISPLCYNRKIEEAFNRLHAPSVLVQLSRVVDRAWIWDAEIGFTLIVDAIDSNESTSSNNYHQLPRKNLTNQSQQTRWYSKYARFVVHCFAYLTFKDAPKIPDPKYSPHDCTIIIPTVDPANPDFQGTVNNALINKPFEVLIVTVGKPNIEQAELACKSLSYSNWRVLEAPKANKREQIICGVNAANTAIIVTIDDHVFLGPQFLEEVVAPFEMDNIGGVGTKKRVVRINAGFCWRDFVNFLGVIYLERRNFDMVGTTSIDGGLSTLSGRAAAYRTSILASADLQHAFLNETTFNPATGKSEIVSVGDDKWLTRWMYQQGWDIRIQYSDAGMIYTTVGDPKKFFGQCLRWMRTSIKENRKMIVDPLVRKRFPWSWYAVFFSNLINFALVWDPMLLMLLYKAMGNSPWTMYAMYAMGLWIFASKIAKPLPHFVRQPSDLKYLPAMIIFSYYHSWIKLQAWRTKDSAVWIGRPIKT